LVAWAHVGSLYDDTHFFTAEFGPFKTMKKVVDVSLLVAWKLHVVGFKKILDCVFSCGCVLHAI
jgi:hypothetical protein